MQVLGSLLEKQVVVVGIVLLRPRRHALLPAQLLVEMVDTMAHILRDPDTLLQQISHVFDMLRLLLQEARLNRIVQRIVAVLVGELTQANRVLQDGLLDPEGLVDGLHGVDWVVGEGDGRGRDVDGPADAAALDEIAFEPVGVREALNGTTLEKPG